ncbi:MAG TPA: hypothetical protein VHE37_11005 [Nevskiaceae bacterium]|nr:hypothetical protein [Nevskiaceae bacterium]
MSTTRWIAATTWLFCAVAATGCQSPDARDAAPPACTADDMKDAPLLVLPDTHAPQNLPTDKSAPYQYAVALPVHRDLLQAGRWNPLAGGWSALTLRVTSQNASSLSARFNPLSLPAGAQLWLCAADGRTRQGPYGDSGGELLTAVVSGNDALIEVLVPIAAQPAVRINLSEMHAGFR